MFVSMTVTQPKPVSEGQTTAGMGMMVVVVMRVLRVLVILMATMVMVRR